MRLTLRSKIQILMAGTILGMIAFIILVLHLLAQREISRAAQRDVKAANEVLAALLTERANALQAQSTLLAAQPIVRATVMTGDRLTVADSAKDCLKQMQAADGVMLSDQDGRVLGAAGTSIDSENPANAQPHHETPGITQKPGSKTEVVEHDGKVMLSVSVPIVMGERLVGTFRSFKSIGLPEVHTLKAVLGSEIALVHKGAILGSSFTATGRLPKQEGKTSEVTLKDGNRFFAQYAPMPYSDRSTGIGYVTLLPYDSVLRLYLWFRIALLGVALLAVAIALVLATTLARGLTRPVESVVASAHILQNGGWPSPMPVSRNDELGILQSVFNEMTAAVKVGQDRLLAMLDTDPVTELHNHRKFQECLSLETQDASETGGLLSLLLVNFDRFHSFNKKYGHAAGDAALKRFSELLQETLPECAISARYGGEVFAVLLPGFNVAGAEKVGEAIRSAAQSELVSEDGKNPLTVSVGCAEFREHSTEAQGLVLAAELAVSLAKELGRNRVCRFDSVPGVDQNADPYQLHRFLKDGSLATIQALAAAVDAKDPYTQGHSLRVAMFAADLARFTRQNPGLIDLVYTTGTLHDVGKIGIPDSILKKASWLDDDERAVMETHPVLGEVIVKKAPQLAATLPGVRHHHERWDGLGYPDGLAGTKIPLLARLLSIADSFDAMTSDRPYRNGLSTTEALSRIQQGASTQYDPELAEQFVQMMGGQSSLKMAA